jgi:hypothetical protein
MIIFTLHMYIHWIEWMHLYFLNFSKTTIPHTLAGFDLSADYSNLCLTAETIPLDHGMYWFYFSSDTLIESEVIRTLWRWRPGGWGRESVLTVCRKRHKRLISSLTYVCSKRNVSYFNIYSGHRWIQKKNKSRHLLCGWASKSCNI